MAATSSSPPTITSTHSIFFCCTGYWRSHPAAYDARLVAMAEYLDALLGVNGTLPLIGDDDGGRVFHPYGERDRVWPRDDGHVLRPV